MGVLADDRPVVLAASLDGLAAGIATPTHRWARQLHHGGPRARPRSQATVRNYVRVMRPALLERSARRTSCGKSGKSQPEPRWSGGGR